MKPLVLTLLTLTTTLLSAPLPKITHTNNKYTLLVDDKPYIILGAQVLNSSGWPSQFEKLLPGAQALGLNTIEVPAYWEDIEPQEGTFRFETFDNIIRLARERNLHLVMLWFGTWKNGTMDYAPAWVKANPTRFPRMLDDGGHPVRVLTPLSEQNQKADARAFTELMKHLKAFDGDAHTVIMVQVENETGSLFTDRDHSPEANRIFASNIPAQLAQVLHKPRGTWQEVFDTEASEAFAAYYVATYVNAVAQAGKNEYPLPFYANVWLREQKNFMRPGEAYPSGGATLNMLDLWKSLTPALDAVSPDNYVLDYVNYQQVLAGYRRPDNPLMVPETGGPRFASNIFYALADFDSLSYAPFGLDAIIDGNQIRDAGKLFADDCRLLQPALPAIAEWQGTGKLHSAVEEQYLTERLIRSSKFDILVQFGTPHPEYGGTFGSQSPNMTGRALVAEIAPDEFIIIGFDAQVTARPARGRTEQSSQFLTAEEGTFINGKWKPTRLLNGDETFAGIHLPEHGTMIRIKLMGY